MPKNTTPKPTAVATQNREAIVDLTQAIAVKSKDGLVKQFRTRVKLSTKNGTLVKMGNMKQTDDSGNKSALFVISAQGFVELGGRCGVVALPTPTITVNGEVQPNPYPDPVTGKVYARAVALGYTPLGQMVPTSRTIIYDAKLANLQDLIAKAQYSENSRFMQMWPLERDAAGKLVRPEGLSSRWTGYPVDEAMSLWVDCACPSVMQWQREMRNREDKAIRTCETFAARNAIASHPAIPRMRKFAQAETTLECTAWFAAEGTMRFGADMLTLDPTKLIEMETKRTGKEITVDHAEEVLTDTATVAEIDGADADETDPGKEEDDGKDTPEPAEFDEPPPVGEEDPLAVNKDAERATLIQIITAQEKKIGARGPIRRARVANGLSNEADLGKEQIDKLKNLVEFYRQQEK